MANAVKSYLGNPSVHEPLETNAKGEVNSVFPRPDLGPSVTEVHWQQEIVAELKRGASALQDVLNENGREALLVRLATAEKLTPFEVALKHVLHVQSAHAAAGFDWIACDDAKLEEVLAPFLDAERAPKGTAAALELARDEGDSWDEITAGLSGPTALKTNGGVDLMHAAIFGTAAQPAAANYVAFTANNEAESASNTTLAGEITTAEGGLLRKQATYAHTNGTSTSTLTITATANSHDTLPVTVNKYGVFNKATSGGTLTEEKKITAATFNAEGDNMTLTVTNTIT